MTTDRPRSSNPLISRWEALPPSQRRRYETLGATIAAVSANAVAGSAATRTKTRWYRKLDKPWFQPPTWVFPVAWTALYVDIAAVTGLSLADLRRRGHDGKFRDLRASLLTNLVLNFGWSFIFFVWKKPLLATLEAALLTASSTDLVRRARDVDSARGNWLVPYAVWCAFATVLTFGLWRRNR